MAYRNRSFEEMSGELTGLADLLVASYGGHTVPDDFLHMRGGHRSTRRPTLLTKPIMTRLDGGKAYSLSVYDTKFTLLLTDLVPWAIANHKPDISEGQMNSFEARIQRGIVLTRDSGVLIDQFSPPLLTDPALPASIGLISVSEARVFVTGVSA